MVTVEDPVDPATALAVVALIEKVGAMVTVSEIVVALVSAPDVPFTVNGYVPTATVEATGAKAVVTVAAAFLIPDPPNRAT